MIFGILSNFFLFSHVSGSNSFKQPLSVEEEMKCLIEFEKGSVEAKNELIERNLRLVAHIAKRYYNSVKDTEEIISVGTIGLIKGIDTYKMNKNVRLATYVARCIENEILMYLRKTKKYQNDIYIQDTLGTDHEGNEVTLEDKLADDDCSIEEKVDLKMNTSILYDIIDKCLTPREKKTICLRYGLCTGEELTQREISEMMGISRSYVSRIEKKALTKLNKEMQQN